MTEGKPAGVKKSGAWTVGTSGNPAGRKPGAELVRQLLEPRRAELIDKAVAMALAGDATALRICIDRLAPPQRAESPAVRIPGLTRAKTLTEKAEAIIVAVGKGAIGPETASVLLQAMAAACRVAEFDDLSRRMAEIEQALADRD